LLLPFAGIGILRLYESALIRQTEAEADGPGGGAVGLPFAPTGSSTRRPVRSPPCPRSSCNGRRRPTTPDAGYRCCRSSTLAEAPILAKPADAAPPARPADPVALQVAKSLRPIVHEAQRMTLAGIRILDAPGVVVAATQDEELGRSLAAQEEVAHALRGAPKAALRERDVDPTDYSFISISRNTAVRVFVAVPILARPQRAGRGAGIAHAAQHRADTVQQTARPARSLPSS
jgi:hypothetical protein